MRVRDGWNAQPENQGMGYRLRVRASSSAGRSRTNACVAAPQLLVCLEAIKGGDFPQAQWHDSQGIREQ